MSEIWNLSALCRCCHADGEFKSLQKPYIYGNVVEVYSNMLRECLGISIVLPPIEASYSICDSCILKLRDANSFRKQVLECEQKFIIYCQNETAVDHSEVEVKLEPAPDELEHKYEFEITGTNKCLKSPKECKEEDADDFETYDERDYDDDVCDKSVNENESKKKIKQEDAEKKMVKKAVKVKKTFKDKIERRKLTVLFCAVCPDARFTNTHDLDTHIDNTHTPPIKCKICSIEFKDYKKFKTHVNKCNPRRFKCNYCEKSYTSAYVLIDHENWAHTKENLLKCDICHKEFGNKSVLRKHILFHQGLQKTCKCEICGKFFNDTTNMKIHVETVHNGVKRFSCHLCEKQFSLKKHLNTHLQKHSGIAEYKCNVCSKTFFEKHVLKIHVERCHLDMKSTKTYQCKVCGKIIESRGPYQRHIREHSSQGALPYTCEICGKNFATKYVINRHILCHLDDERTKFPCKICEKKFTTKATLNRHIKSLHSTENITVTKVKCPICKLYVKNIERHQKKHNIRPHACPQCPKTYPEKNALNRHVKFAHLGIKLHSCEICLKEYTRQDVLKKHMQRKHLNLFNNYANIKVEPEQSDQNIPGFKIGFLSQ